MQLGAAALGLLLLPAVLSIGPVSAQEPRSRPEADAEDPEAVLAERDDLRAQLAVKNSEFLAQHRRADELLHEVRELQRRLKSEESTEQVLEGKLQQVRALLADDANGASSAAAAARPARHASQTQPAPAPRRRQALLAAGGARSAVRARAAPRPRAARAQSAARVQARLLGAGSAKRRQAPTPREQQAITQRVQPASAPPKRGAPRHAAAAVAQEPPGGAEGVVPAPAGRAPPAPALDLTDAVTAEAPQAAPAQRADAPHHGGQDDSDFHGLEVQLKDEDSKIDLLDMDVQEVEQGEQGEPLGRTASAHAAPPQGAQPAQATDPAMPAQAADAAMQDAGRGPAGAPAAARDEDLEAVMEGDPDAEGDAAFLAQLVKQ